ncbi:arginine/lysine/ornithine decarboxylase [Mycobacterium sp. AZCC_0083]|nr:hypothetical protein [Mycobacterium sp. AZCC_0083]MBB5167513.1 arginine/lysine/ornithine decarboxylase [Mycobacterium sp. AZCC_0083]
MMVYAALDAWRRRMVERGHDLLDVALTRTHDVRERIEEIPDVEVLDREPLGEHASHDLDRLQIVMDIETTGTSGYQGVDWIREHRQLDLHVRNHRRMVATISFADDDHTVERLITALSDWRQAAREFERPPRIELPSPGELELDTVILPRDSFFGAAEMVPAEQAAGRVSAEQITPYPSGVPAVVPGEELNDAVIDYLRSGADAGMTLPDPSDPKMHHFRVVT